VIRLDEIGHVFTTERGESVEALRGVSLEVRQNEFVSIVGASGCGKSTLLRIVAGILAPTRGRAEVGGRVVDGPRPDTGFVFQAATLLPWADVLTNVLFPLRILRQDRRQGAAAARSLLKLAGLDGFERHMPDELSGGMQQRVAICRALIHDPTVLLMDEPFGALDALTREEMSVELLRIWSERPKTVLMVTHSITEAVMLSDRVVVMSPRPGRIVDIIDVPLERPRRFEDQASAAFQRCAARIRGHIFRRAEHAEAAD